MTAETAEVFSEACYTLTEERFKLEAVFYVLNCMVHGSSMPAPADTTPEMAGGAAC